MNDAFLDGRPILLLGSRGFLGRRLAARLGTDRAVRTYFRRPVGASVQFNALKHSLAAIGAPLERVRHAVLLFGITRIDACARDPEGSARLNVDATCRVIDELVEHDIRPVFVSTDVVFDGRRGGYREEDPAVPVLTYGRQKLEVERYLDARTRSYLTLRLPKVIGDRPGAGGLLDEWMGAVRTGTPVRCAEDQFFSPIGLEDAATAILRLLAGGMSGTYHVGGPNVWDRASLFEAFAASLDLPIRGSEILQRCSICDFPEFAEARPADTSMVSSRMYRALDFVPSGMTDVCVSYAKALHRQGMAIQNK